MSSAIPNEGGSCEDKPKYINPYRQFYNGFVPNWLMCRIEVKPGPKLLYARLCQYAGKDGKCFPKQQTLAKELGTSVRTVARWMKELKDHGLIETTRLGKRCSNRYFFLEHPWMEVPGMRNKWV